MTEKPTYKELEKKIKELEQAESYIKHNEEQLIHSHDLMDYIISHARSAIAVHDRDLKYIYVSKRYLKEYKVKKQNVIGKHHYDVFPDLPQKWRDVHKRSLAGEVLIGEDDPYYRDDGSVDWTRWECRPWYESNGSIGGIIIYSEVITERKKIEEALRESEHKLATHLQHTPIGALSWDLDFKIIEWNPGAENIFGFSKAEAMDKHVTELILPKKMKELVDGIFRDLISEKGGTRSTNENITKNGRRIICDWYNTTLKDVAGNIIGVASLVHDITERSQTLESLKKQKEFNEKIVQTSSAIIVGLDKNHKIKIFNKGAEKITEFKAKEVIGNDWFEIFFEPDIYDEMNKVWESSWGRKFSSYVNSILSKNGDKKIISWQTAGMYDGADETTHMLISIGEDITERTRAEELLKESENRYRSLIHKIQAAVVVHGADTEIIACNPKAQELLGLTQDQMLYRKANDLEWNFLNDSGNKMALEQYPVNQVLTNRQLLRNQIVGIFRPAKDDIVWVLINADPVFDDERKIQQVIVTFMNITEQKKMEKALLKSEDKYRALAEECPISIMTFDHKGIVTFVNEWHLKTFAKSKHKSEFFIGKKITELPGFVRAEVIPELEKVLQEGRPVILEDVYFPEFTGGHSGYQSIKAVPTYKGKKIIGGILIREDVTKRNLSENALKESEEKYRSMMESMKDAAYICSPELYIEYTNPTPSVTV